MVIREIVTLLFLLPHPSREPSNAGLHRAAGANAIKLLVHRRSTLLQLIRLVLTLLTDAQPALNLPQQSAQFAQEVPPLAIPQPLDNHLLHVRFGPRLLDIQTLACLL